VGLQGALFSTCNPFEHLNDSFINNLGLETEFLVVFGNIGSKSGPGVMPRLKLLRKKHKLKIVGVQSRRKRVQSVECSNVGRGKLRSSDFESYTIYYIAIVESRRDIPYGNRNMLKFAHFYVLSAHYIALLCHIKV
jgi:hypothetical protein